MQLSLIVATNRLFPFIPNVNDSIQASGAIESAGGVFIISRITNASPNINIETLGVGGAAIINIVIAPASGTTHNVSMTW